MNMQVLFYYVCMGAFKKWYLSELQGSHTFKTMYFSHLLHTANFTDDQF